MSSNNLTQNIVDAFKLIGVTVVDGLSRLTTMLEMNGSATFRLDGTEFTLHKSASGVVTAQVNAKTKPANKPASKPSAPEPSQYKRRRHP